MSVTSEQIDDAILNAAQIDYLDPWAITRLLVAEVDSGLGADPTAVALDAVERLLTKESLRAGDLVPPGEFRRWSDDRSQPMALVRARTADLERHLNVGDVAWFALVD